MVAGGRRRDLSCLLKKRPQRADAWGRQNHRRRGRKFQSGFLTLDTAKRRKQSCLPMNRSVSDTRLPQAGYDTCTALQMPKTGVLLVTPLVLVLWHDFEPTLMESVGSRRRASCWRRTISGTRPSGPTPAAQHFAFGQAALFSLEFVPLKAHR